MNSKEREKEVHHNDRSNDPYAATALTGRYLAPPPTSPGLSYGFSYGVCVPHELYKLIS